MLLLLLLRGFA